MLAMIESSDEESISYQIVPNTDYVINADGVSVTETKTMTEYLTFGQLRIEPKDILEEYDEDLSWIS